jgi:hypothetical protein
MDFRDLSRYVYFNRQADLIMALDKTDTIDAIGIEKGGAFVARQSLTHGVGRTSAIICWPRNQSSSTWENRCEHIE